MSVSKQSLNPLEAYLSELPAEAGRREYEANHIKERLSEIVRNRGKSGKDVSQTKNIEIETQKLEAAGHFVNGFWDGVSSHFQLRSFIMTELRDNAACQLHDLRQGVDGIANFRVATLGIVDLEKYGLRIFRSDNIANKSPALYLRSVDLNDPRWKTNELDKIVSGDNKSEFLLTNKTDRSWRKGDLFVTKPLWSTRARTSSIKERIGNFESLSKLTRKFKEDQKVTKESFVKELKELLQCQRWSAIVSRSVVWIRIDENQLIETVSHQPRYYRSKT